jgi:c(7)-type cytochrome triheme protein
VPSRIGLGSPIAVRRPEKEMELKRSFTRFAVFCAVFGLVSFAATKAPEKMVFESKTGKVTFLHDKHGEREKGDCKVCHDALWPQSKTAPLNYKAAIHKTAETKKMSCAHCHVDGGKAFASKGNCFKCHEKKAAGK